VGANEVMIKKSIEEQGKKDRATLFSV